MLVGMILWILCGLIFFCFGIYCMFRSHKAAFGFWANAKMFPVKNVKAYNRAVGKLWVVFGTVEMLLGLSFLGGQNSPFVVLAILGLAAEAIAAMAVYTVVIEPKYRERA